MTTSSTLSRLPRFCVSAFVALGCFAAAAALRAQPAGDPGVVTYESSIAQIQGQIPFTQSYDLWITSPNTVTEGSSVTVTFAVSVNTKPDGVSDATAQSYLKFSPSQLTYTKPFQKLAVNVTMAVPADAVPGGYGYRIIATGFPNPFGNLINSGSSINATVTVAPTFDPPTVAISTPEDGEVFTVAVAALPATIPFALTAHSTGTGSSAITSVSAVLDTGTSVLLPTINGLQTTSVSASGSLQVSKAGVYKVTAHATNQGGTATDVHTFMVKVDAAPPVVVINTPVAPNNVYTHRYGESPAIVPFTFTATSSVSSIRTLVAKVDGTPVTFTPVGLNTPIATGSVNLSYTTAGTHTVEVFTTDDYGNDSDVSTFIVNVVRPAPTIDITTPTENQFFEIPSGSTTVDVPFRFVTTSNNDFVVNSVSAQLGTSSVAIASTTGLGTANAVSVGTLTGLPAGTYILTTKGTSSGISVTDTVTFVVGGAAVSGHIFFDADFDGVEDAGEFGLAGVTVQLTNAANQPVGTLVTNASGDYVFKQVTPGTYTVSAVLPTGLTATTVTQRSVIVSGSTTVLPMGFGLNFKAINGAIANGFTIGFWKNNLEKALAGKTGGTQVSKATLEAYTAKIADFALAPFDGITMRQAANTMGYEGPTPSLLLAKQLVASEYNYQNGAYLSGNASLTFLFLAWGEFVLQNPGQFSSAYIIWAKDWFDAYNNSHGGAVKGPAPL